MKMKKTLLMLWMAVCLIVSFTGCTSEEMDYNNPDVALFVKQLKSGTYKMKNEKGVVEVPHFTEEDIPELLKYAEDLCREHPVAPRDAGRAAGGGVRP